MGALFDSAVAKRKDKKRIPVSKEVMKTKKSDRLIISLIQNTTKHYQFGVRVKGIQKEEPKKGHGGGCNSALVRLVSNFNV